MAQRGGTTQRPNGVTQGKIQPFKLVLLGRLFCIQIVLIGLMKSLETKVNGITTPNKRELKLYLQ